MQKGIGAAPFAIVAALIIALAVGFWATQPAQAAVGDVVLNVEDVDNADNDITFVDPGADAPGEDLVLQADEDAAFGPPGLTVETGNTLEATFAKDNPTGFRGAVERGAWVEIQARVVATEPDDAAATYEQRGYKLDITVTGEGSLSPSTTLTSASCTSQGATNATKVCQFAVYGTGNAGAFSVSAVGTGASALTSILVPKDGSLKGQWVGIAASAEVLDEAPASSATDPTDDVVADDGSVTTDNSASRFGMLSPAVILSGTTGGLTEGNAGFLFQLKDSAGQVALTSDADDRDAPRVRAVTDTGADLELAATGSLGTAGASAYVAITDEMNVGGYPTLTGLVTQDDDNNDVVTYRAGGLIAVGLTALEDGEASIGRIVIDLPAGGTVEHSIAVAGNPDGDMSSVSAAASPLNLGLGNSHEREITLRDAHGTAVPLNAAGIAASIGVAETDDDDKDLWLDVAAKSGASGVYVLTVTANEDETDDIAAAEAQGDDPAVEAETVGREDGDTRDADVGLHAFSVTIKNLAGDNDGVEKTADADGNPLEAHVASGIEALSITSVTADQSDAELLSGDVGTPSVSVAAGTRLLNVTFSALGDDDAAPANGSAIAAEHTSSNGRFIGSATSDDVGEASIRFIFGGEASNTTLIFGSGAYEQVLLVNVVDPDAPADVGPRDLQPGCKRGQHVPPLAGRRRLLVRV